MMQKQISATDDSSAAINSIVESFSAMSLPRLASAELYLGIPFQILENLSQAINEQRLGDEKKRFLNRMRYAGILKERSIETFKWSSDTYPLADAGVIESALNINFIRQCKSLIVAGPPGVGYVTSIFM